MAKRFIETQIFEKELLSTLEAPYKLLFFYYITKCDHAGILDHHALRLASFILDHSYTVAEVDEAFNGKLVTIGKKWFMPSFVEFQYGKLNEANRAHNSVIKLLEKHSICSNSLQFKPLISTLQGAKDMDKVKDMDKAKDKPLSNFTKPTANEVLIYGETLNPVFTQSDDFVDFYESKGWLIGKNKMKDWKAAVRTWNRKNVEKQQTQKAGQHKITEYLG